MQNSSLLFSLLLLPSLPINITINLYEHLEKINKLYSIGKSTKDNHNIFTYDYIYFLSIHNIYIKLLNKQGKMITSNQIT